MRKRGIAHWKGDTEGRCIHLEHKHAGSEAYKREFKRQRFLWCPLHIILAIPLCRNFRPACPCLCVCLCRSLFFRYGLRVWFCSNCECGYLGAGVRSGVKLGLPHAWHVV